MIDPAPEPPFHEPDHTGDELQRVKKERVVALNEVYKQTAGLLSYEKDLLIYRLIKKGICTVYQIAGLMEYSPNTIYKIIEKFEKEESNA